MKRLRLVSVSLLMTSLAAVVNAETYIVLIKDFEFNPKKVHLIQGDTIRWENHDKDAGHSVQVTMPGMTESDKFYPGESFSFTFKQAGDFAYHCGYHPGMKGVVYVIADPSRPPDISDQMAEPENPVPQEDETPKIEETVPEPAAIDETAPVEDPIEHHGESDAHRERISK